MKHSLKHLRLQIVWTAFTTAVVLLLLLCIGMVTGCSDDADEPLPAYVQTLCELETDSTGRAWKVHFDDGHESLVKTRADGLVPDSIYRIKATTLEYADGVELYNAAVVFSPMPLVFKSIADIKTDAVEVLAAWRSPRYINLRLSVMRGHTAGHFMGFADLGVKLNANGSLTKTVKFYHDQNGDDPNYHQETIVSCPVYQMTDVLRHGTDSVSIAVETRQGEYRFTTLY